jgi:putative ABC transport system permease protein
MMVAHSNGLTEVFEDPDEEVIHHIEGEEIRLATTPSNDQYQLPSTIFSMDHINHNGDEWLAIKGILGSQVLHLVEDEWVETNISAEWLHSDEEAVLFGSPNGWQTSDGLSSPEEWTGLRGGYLLDESGTVHRFTSTGTELITEPASDCDGRVFADDGVQLCSTSYGVLVEVEPGIDLPRLPVTVDLGGIGILPQLLLATNTSLSPAEGNVLFADRLNLLNQSEGVLINGLIPYAYGDTSAELLSINGSMSSIDAPGLDELESIIIGLVNLSDGEKLAAADEGERSMLIINDGNQTAILAWLDDVAGTESMNLNIRASKEEASETAQESAGALSAMFLVFGTFTIGAGVLLVLTIVIMLAEQRRTDEAIIRALGLKRSDMRSLAMMEGVMTSSMAAICGGLFGIFLAWLISLAFSSVFASAGAEGLAFSFSLESMLIGMSCGFLIAMSTLFLTAMWTSRLNIVQALRGINPSRQRGVPWWMILGIIVLLGGGALSGLSMLLMGSESLLRLAMWHITAALFIMGLVPLFTFVLPHLMNWSVRNCGRNTMSVLGVSLFAWALIPDALDPIRASSNPDEISFAVLGLIEVFAGVMILSGLAPQIASWFGRRKFLTKKFGPLVNVSLAHPGAAPLRTAVVMGMFSLTVFSVIVLAGYSVQFESHSTGYVEDASGDFEILLTSSRQSPIELSENPAEWNLTSTSPDDIDAIGRVSRAVVWIEKGNDSIGYVLRGVDQGFVEHGAIPLHDWDSELGETQEEAWASLMESENIVFIDSSFSLIDPNTGESISGLTISIGESISLIDISSPGNRRIVQVGGILSQSSNLFSSGVWMNGNVVDEQFGGVVTRVYVSHGEDVDSNILQEELAQDLSRQGVNSSVIEEDILLILGLVFAILSIFQSYLALGLIVGIAGIGVVTYRSVSERSGQIGMMRALGFRRKMVTYSMILEISWVAVLGMLNGALVALAFHSAIHDSFWKDQGVELILPWATMFWLLIGGWMLVLLATFIPVSRATKITPAEALSTLD